jgi:hypothetical protein
MLGDAFKSLKQSLRLSLALLADADRRHSTIDREQLREKIDARKYRRVPVGNFILLLAAIVLTLIVLEYFI